MAIRPNNGTGSRRMLLYFLLLVLLLEALFTWWVTSNIVNEAESEFLLHAELTARTINPQLIARLQGSLSDSTLPEYQRLKEQLVATREISSSFLHVYLAGIREDGHVFYYVDSSNTSSDQGKTPGESAEVSEDIIRSVFSSGDSVMEKQVRDNGEEFIGVFVPIMNPRTGSPIAILGVYLSARNWRNDLLGKLLLPIGSTVLLVLVILGGFTFLIRRDKRNGVLSGNWWSRHAEGLVTAVAGAIIVFSAAFAFHTSESHARRLTFSQMASSEAALTVDAIRDICDYQLGGLTQFYRSSEHVEREEFKQYTSYLVDDPVVQAMAWVPRVGFSSDGYLEERPHSEGLKDLTIRDWYSGEVVTFFAEQTEHYPILYIEPFSENSTLLGMDLFTSNTLSSAMHRSISAGGSSVASDLVELPQGTTAGSVIFVFRTIFENSYNDALSGFVAVMIRAESLLLNSSHRGGIHSAVEMGLYETDGTDNYRIIASTSPECSEMQEAQSELMHVEDSPVLVLPILAFGRLYVIVAHPSVEFSSIYPVRSGVYALFLGSIVVFTLSLFVDSLSNRRKYLEQLVYERTSKLQDSEARWKFALEGAGDGVWDWDLRTNAMFFSQKWKEMLGYQDEEIGDDHQEWISRIHPKDQERCLLDVQRVVMAETSVYQNEHRMLCKDGGYKWILARGKVVEQSDDGKPLRIIGTHTDITERKRSEEALNESMEKLTNITQSAITALAAAVDLRDPYTAGHQRRVAQLAVAIALDLNMDSDRISTLKLAALVHDVGKIQVPAEILNRPGKLGDLEMKLIRKHPEAGKELFKNVEFAWPMADMIYQHHERLDGSGYPQGLTDDEILFEAKILAVADVVEAMSSHRPYRQALGIEAALQEIEQNAVVLYDKQVVEVCLKLFKEDGFGFED